jgi:dUTP pyrophosphatase
MLDVALKILDARLGSTWPLPSYATDASAGLDLRACLERDIQLAPGETRMISAGISIYLADPNYAAMLLPRSGLGAKGLVLGNLVGLIDADYQGPLLMACWNRSAAGIDIAPGDRIAQLMIVPIARARFTIVEQFDATTRGSGGYGHTGLR